MDVNDNFTQSVHQAQMDRIAELEAENERLTANRDELMHMVGLLKAELAALRERDRQVTEAMFDYNAKTRELAALKARRCETCDHNEYPRDCGKSLEWAQWDSDKSQVSSDVPIECCSEWTARPTP
jgi:hypothetical protein